MASLLASFSESADTGDSETFPMQCSTLRVNGHVMLKGRPCKIIDMSTSISGKHGHAKVHLVGLDLFTDEKYEDIYPSTHNMDVPYVTMTEYKARNLEDGYLTLMGDNQETKEYIKLPDDEVGKEIRKKCENDETFLVTVLKAMGETRAVLVKSMEI